MISSLLESVGRLVHFEHSKLKRSSNSELQNTTIWSQVWSTRYVWHHSAVEECIEMAKFAQNRKGSFQLTRSGMTHSAKFMYFCGNKKIQKFNKNWFWFTFMVSESRILHNWGHPHSYAASMHVYIYKYIYCIYTTYNYTTFIRTTFTIHYPWNSYV